MKTAIISQARMTSTRLPGKVLMKIKEKTVLEYHIERLKLSSLPVIIAMTEKNTDEPIVSLCRQLGVTYFRGDELDVLSRFYKCALTNKLDTVVRVTSDCPLIDGALIKKGYDLFVQKKADYLSNTIERTFPRGFDFEVFTFSALETAYKNAKEKPEREHVTPYIWRNNPDKFNLLKYQNNKDQSNYRITVDTAEDFNLIKSLIENFNADKKSYEKIITILEENPDIAGLNKIVKHKEYSE